MFNMERQLPYAINYKTLKRYRTVENLFLWSVFILSILIQLLKCETIEGLVCQNVIVVLNVLNYISIIGYGLLYIIVEIIMQPIVASERRKGFIDNSLGTKLLNMPVTNYYDNDSIKEGAYKLLVNCYENCYFTYNIAKEMLLNMVLKNTFLFIALLIFAYFGISNNIIAIPILQLFLSSLFLMELVYHIIFYFKLKNLCEQFRNIFSDKKNATEKLKYAVYMTLEYETSLAYNKAPNNDAIYKRLNEKLTQEWEEIKERYDIR